MSVYNVSKHAVVTLSETLFHDLRLAKARMGVSVLCPAYVPTNIRNSERNRPAELTHDAPPTPSQIAARERSEKAIASGRLSAAEVARMTFDAVRDDRFYVITHPKMLASVELRFQDLLAQRNPSDPYTIKPEVAVRPRETRARRSLLEETQLSPAAGWRAGSPPVPGGAGRCRA